MKAAISFIGISSLISIATMVRGKRELLMRRLRPMVADPATTEEQRALLSEKLGQLATMVSDRPRG